MYEYYRRYCPTGVTKKTGKEETMCRSVGKQEKYGAEKATITLVSSVPFDLGHLGKAEAPPHIRSKREEWEFLGDKTTEEGIWPTGITLLWQTTQKQTELQMKARILATIYKTDFRSGWERRKKFLSILTWEEGRAEEPD